MFVIRSRTTFAVALAIVVFPLVVNAKGDGRSFVIEGSVRNVRAVEGDLEFWMRGDLLVTECKRGKCTTTAWERGAEMLLHVSAGDSFFAMTPDRRGGAIQEPNKLAEIVRRAAEHGQRTRLELRNPRITFGASGKVLQLEAHVGRITDYDLH